MLDGGAGNDTMSGGAGTIRHLCGRCRRRRGHGSRRRRAPTRCRARVSYTLGANVENLTLTGTGAINATGNTLDNTLTGNAGNNVLDGGAGNDTLSGGAGNDTMIGGAGNDTYVVDAAGDVVTEAAGEGTDTVQSSVSYSLGANVENLTLTGTGNINATGNTLDNMLTGNAGNNVLERRRRQRHPDRRRR